MSIIIFPDGRVKYGKGTLRGDFPNWDSVEENWPCFTSLSVGQFSPKEFTVDAELTNTDLFWIIIVQGYSPGDPVYVMQEGTSEVRRVGEAHSDLSDLIHNEGLVLSIRFRSVKRPASERIHHTFILILTMRLRLICLKFCKSLLGCFKSNL